MHKNQANVKEKRDERRKKVVGTISPPQPLHMQPQMEESTKMIQERPWKTSSGCQREPYTPPHAATLLT